MPRDASPAAAPGGQLRASIMGVLLFSAVAGGTLLFQPQPLLSDPIDLGGLPEIGSRNGVLAATLVAAPRTVHIGKASFLGAGFNGSYGGPVLRVRAGDRVRLHVVNRMADAINLHFHGMRVSPQGHGDNVRIAIPPGQSFDYDFGIPPNHPPGLFWYHDHAPGAAEAHVTAGLSGALLVEGFAARFAGLSAVPQKLLVLKDWNDSHCTGIFLRRELHCRVVSINAQSDWRDVLPPGGVELWRVSNQGANLTLHLRSPGLMFRVIGRDGMPARNTAQSDRFDIMPASRVDVLLRAASPGLHRLFADSVLTGAGQALTTERAIGGILNGPYISATPLNPSAPPQQDLRAWHVDARRTIRFTQDNAKGEYYINGKLFDPARTDFRVPLGNVEEWTVQNATDDFHEFHIHQVGFEVTEINGVAQTFSGYVDDVAVPTHGEVRVLIAFTDPVIVGHIMFHCHVLNHEDHGMMSMLEVYRPGVAHMCRFGAQGSLK